MNPAIQEIIRRMAVNDGTLRQSINPYRYDEDGNNFESVPGPSTPEQVHPDAGSRPDSGMGEHNVIQSRSGGGSRTVPTATDMFSPDPRLTHTGGNGMPINPMMLLMQNPQNGMVAPDQQAIQKMVQMIAANP